MPIKTETTDKIINTKAKNAAIAARSAAPPKIPKQILDQLVPGPMSPAEFNDLSMALKKAPVERVLGAELTHHLATRAAKGETWYRTRGTGPVVPDPWYRARYLCLARVQNVMEFMRQRSAAMSEPDSSYQRRQLLKLCCHTRMLIGPHCSTFIKKQRVDLLKDKHHSVLLSTIEPNCRLEQHSYYCVQQSPCAPLAMLTIG